MVLLLWLVPRWLSAQNHDVTSERAEWQNKFWLSGQINVVGQFYPAFPAAYSGSASFRSDGQAKPTWVATIYSGYALTQNTEAFFDVESAKGSGVSGALGLGGLGNLDAVTDTRDSATPYIARAQIRQIIPLTSHRVEIDRNPLGLSATVPDRRIELRLGKMSLTDFFDTNAVGSDSHLQFLNYSIDNNAAYDIAANARGYTYAMLVELYQPLWAVRFAEALEPKDNTGHQTQWSLGQASSSNLELEYHPAIKKQQLFTIRALSFLNRGEMGDYREAAAAYLTGKDSSLDLAGHIHRAKNWGWGLNGECTLPAGVRAFGRFGWNEGKRETFQFAEADRTVAFGTDFDGRAWKRPRHRVGLAFAANALTNVHRTYLELGGQSYLLGDGGLTYGHEKVLEGYYNAHLGRGIFAAFDVQRIWNPGYNQARGPVLVFGLRLHLEGDLHFN